MVVAELGPISIILPLPPDLSSLGPTPDRPRVAHSAQRHRGQAP